MLNVKSSTLGPCDHHNNGLDDSSSSDDSVSETESVGNLTSQMGGVSLGNDNDKSSVSSTTFEATPHPYFSTFKKFDHDAGQNDFVNFGRLAIKHKWNVGGEQWKSEWLKCFPKSWLAMHKAKKGTLSSIIEYYAVFALHQYAVHYLSFAATAQDHGWPVGSRTWRREWLNVLGYSYVKSRIIEDANKKITVNHKTAARHIAANKKSLVEHTAIPTRNPNQYFEAHRSAKFSPEYSKSFSSDFANLALVKKWKAKSSQYKQEKQKAFDEEFNRWYDKEPDKNQILQILQALCLEIDVEVGESVTKCKKVSRPFRLYTLGRKHY